jgi:hypothetical protein
LARSIVLSPHLFRLAGMIKFLVRTIHPPIVRHLDPSIGGPTTILAAVTVALLPRWPSHIPSAGGGRHVGAVERSFRVGEVQPSARSPRGANERLRVRVK